MPMQAKQQNLVVRVKTNKGFFLWCRKFCSSLLQRRTCGIVATWHAWRKGIIKTKKLNPTKPIGIFDASHEVKLAKENKLCVLIRLIAFYSR